MEKSQEPVTIYTIGYGNRSVDEFIEALQEHEIAYLIDVRSAPYSRYKSEFSREPLEAELQRQGVRYVFMGDTLGGQPDDEECYDVNGKVDYERVKKTERYQFGIKRLQTAVAKKQCVALMCSEGKPENCHRSKLIGETLEEKNIRVTHIDESDELQPHDGFIKQLTEDPTTAQSGQLELGLTLENTFRSRKR